MYLTKLNLSILHWVCHLVRHLKKDGVESVARSKSDFNYDSKHAFYRFYKGYDKFEKISLDSKYNKIKELNKLLSSFKAVWTKKGRKRLKKERVMKNVDEFYKKCYNAYKSDYDTDAELNAAKKKKFHHKQFELVDKKDEELKLDEETRDLKLIELQKMVEL